MPDFDAALRAKAEAEKSTSGRPAGFDKTMPLERSAMGLAGATAKPAPEAMFPAEAPTAGGGMFPKESPRAAQPYDMDRPEPTVMKQAAELLEEALREAGGSLDEIGHNPLFQNAGLKSEGPTVAEGPSDDLLAAVRGTDGRPPAGDIKPARPGELPTVPAFTPDGAAALQLTPGPSTVSGASAQVPAQATPYVPQPLAMEEQVRPLPTPKKRRGGGGLAVASVLVVTLLAGGGVWAYKTHAFGIGAPPAPTAPTASAAPSAPPSVAPSASAEVPEAGTAISEEAGATATDAAVAAATSASAVPSASAAPSAAVEKPVVKPVYRPPPPPTAAPVATGTAEPTAEPKPTEPKPTEPKPTEPKPTAEPKPTEPKPVEPAPKPAEPKPADPN
jgi:hypothetical protein